MVVVVVVMHIVIVQMVIYPVVQVVVEVVEVLILLGMEEPVIHLLLLLQMVDLKVVLVEWVILVFQDLVDPVKLPVVVVEQLLMVEMVSVVKQVLVVQVEKVQLQVQQ
tara:strand:- start:133 stop:456 length:324 start_codon:yes stop_codon:yes gene_type:complete